MSGLGGNPEDRFSRVATKNEPLLDKTKETTYMYTPSEGSDRRERPDFALGYNFFFMLNSTEHENLTAHKCQNSLN